MIRILLVLIAKDHLRRLRAPLGFLVVLSFPIVFALMLAVTFGTGDNDAPRIRLRSWRQVYPCRADAASACFPSAWLAALGKDGWSDVGTS